MILTNRIKDDELKQILMCECGHNEHQIVFTTFMDVENSEEVYISYYLEKKSFFKRLLYGIKYIFGYQSKYGAFGEIVTTKEELKTIVNNF